MHEQWGEKEVTLQTDSTEHPSYHNIPCPHTQLCLQSDIRMLIN